MEDASDVQFGTYWPQQQTVSPALYGYYYPEYGNIDQQQLAEIQQANHLLEQHHTLPDMVDSGGEMTADAEADYLQVRQAELALLSWGLEDKKIQKSSSNKLSISMRASDFDLKGFLSQRGTTQLHGLHKASAQGDRAAIMSIMKREGPNAPLNELDENGCSPLMYAALADAVPAVEMLLNFGAKRETVDFMGRTAVHYAAFFGRNRSLKFLIEAASDWTPRDVYGRTPLHWVTASRNTKCLMVLLKHGRIVFGDINPRDNEGMTPLMCAAQYGKPRHIELMNEAECDFTAIDIEGKTVLHWTADNSDPGCIHAIIDCYPPLLNQEDVNGLTVLHLAAAKGSTSVVDGLLNIDGINKDPRDILDRTPLHYASMEGHGDVVQLLTEHRALDSCIDKQGLTALHYAVQGGSEQCAQILSNTDYTTHVQDSEGYTPLMRACQNGLTAVTKALLQNATIASSVNFADAENRTALHFACLAGSPDCISCLINSGADPNLLDKSHTAPIFIVCEAGFHNCISPLVTGGANIHTFDQDGDAPIHKAVLHAHVDIVEALIISGSSTEITNTSGYTPLQLATYSGLSDVTKVLLQNGCAHSILSPSGMTALHMAAAEGHTDTAAVLLEYGAHVNMTDATDERHTAMDHAVKNGHTECSELLQQFGGVSVDQIRTMAAISIQTAFRAHRARHQLEDQKGRLQAAIVVQKWVRRYFEQLRFRRMKKEHSAAIVLQAATRGFLQRRQYEIEVTKYREKKKQKKLIEDFSNMITAQKSSLLRPIYIETETATEFKGSKEEKEEECRRHQLAKLESCLKMRDLYTLQQKRWEEFREGERQRRKEKARHQELDRLAGILSESAARRRFYQEQFEYTTVVRSHDYAAVVIQRAYQSFKLREQQLRVKQEEEKRRESLRRNRAARIIQQAWRKYSNWKLYLARNYRYIKAGPVVKLESHLGPPTHWKSYERGTIVSGSRRRRLHQTAQSEFRIYRPLPTLPISSSQQLASTMPPNVSFRADKFASSRIQRLQKNWPWFQQLVATPPNHSYGSKEVVNNGERHQLPTITSPHSMSSQTSKKSQTITPQFRLPKIVQL